MEQESSSATSSASSSAAIPDRPYAQPDDVLYDWQERAAIYEFDAGMPRADAELQAQFDEQRRRCDMAAAKHGPRA